MEQIDLRAVISNPHNRWSEDDELERNEKLTQFPHSIAVATSFLEMDFVKEWLAKTHGQEGNNWDCLFYYKEAYNFGYAEYFFQDKDFLIIFKNELPRFYGVFPNGERLRTNLQGELFEVD